MEPTQQNSIVNNNVVSENQNQLPGWVSGIMNLYGTVEFLAGILALVAPVFTGLVMVAIGGGKEGFSQGYQIYAFVAASALPAFILSYGLFKKRKWVIACLAISLLFTTFNNFLLKNEALTVSPDAVPSSAIGLLNIFPFLILILVFTYREKLQGKYFAIVPIILMLIAMVYADVLVQNTIKSIQEQTRNDQTTERNEQSMSENIEAPLRR